MKSLNKIAFYIADKRHFDYFDNVIQEVINAGGEVMLIINDTRSRYDSGQVGTNYTDEMALLAKERELPYLFSRDAIASGVIFSIIVSTFSYTYKVPLGEKILKRAFVRRISQILRPVSQWIPRRLAKKITFYASENYPVNRWEYPEHLLAHESVFFPKGLDVSDDYPNPILREIADHYFCHGRYDRRIMEKNIEKEIFEIGYPRYDRLKQSEVSTHESLVDEFGMDRSKPLICWLPTYVANKRNILEWIPQFEDVNDSYNLLIRPHPKQIERDDGSLIDLLKKTGFYIDLKDDRDMTLLYAQSWLVCCDYGGTIFSAIYTGANLLLLNMQDHHAIAAKRSRSADIHLRTQLYNLTPDAALQKGGLVRVIGDQKLRDQQSEQVKRAQKEYFGDVKLGEGSVITAKKLLSLNR